MMRITYLVGLFIITGCMHNRANKSFFLGFDKQGHRGCRSLMPENTIPAMTKAIDLGVSTLEMDVVITTDKHVLLSHDPFFSHYITTRPDGKFVTPDEETSLNIYKMTYEETLMYDVGLKPHPAFAGQQKFKVSKPLLSDLIDAVEKYCRDKHLRKVNYNIETKTQPSTDNIFHPAPEEFVDLLMQVILSKKIEKRLTIQSFDFRTLQYLHKKHPAVKTAMLIEGADTRPFADQLTALGFTPSVYSPYFALVTKDLIDACHLKKVRVIPWTVNEALKIRELKSLGVDGIITDDPALFNEPEN